MIETDRGECGKDYGQQKRRPFEQRWRACGRASGQRGQALADAFDPGCVQRIDLRPSLMLALLANAAGEHERGGEGALRFSLALDLAHGVANDPAEIGSDRTLSVLRPFRASDRCQPRLQSGRPLPASNRTSVGSRDERYILATNAAGAIVGECWPWSQGESASSCASIA
jgi:hypothetical protein